MKCAWQALLNLLPQSLRPEVDRLGKERLQELRLRRNLRPELICHRQSTTLPQTVTAEMLQFVINAACRYSPWTATTAAEGYITAAGGHRIGLCGEVVLNNGKMADIKGISSLCIRVSRDFEGIAARAPSRGSLLILGSPGSGKTTLLRDLIRIRSNQGQGSVAVVDERRELFPLAGGNFCFSAGDRTDVLSGCPKAQGIELLLRTMGPSTIAVDEITAREDCDALLGAAWCGVDLIATAHAGNLKDFLNRPIYKPLIESRIFHTVLVMQEDKSWREERLHL